MSSYLNYLGKTVKFYVTVDGSLLRFSEKRLAASTRETKVICFDPADGCYACVVKDKIKNERIFTNRPLEANLISVWKQYRCVKDIDSYIGWHHHWFDDSFFIPDNAKDPFDTRKDPTKDGAICANPQCGTFMYMGQPGTKCYPCRQDPYRCDPLNVWLD